MKVLIEWDGVEYNYDTEAIDLVTAMEIKSRPEQWGLKTWSRECDDMNPFALNYLLYAMKRQAGENPEITKITVSEPVRFYNTFAAAMSKAIEEMAAAAKANPSGKDTAPATPSEAPQAADTTTPILANSEP